MTANTSDIIFISVTDRYADNPQMSNNGGDYYFGRTIAQRNGNNFGVYHWTSAEFSYCSKCGRFTAHNDYDGDKCPENTASDRDFENITEENSVVINQDDRFWEMWMDKLGRGQFLTRRLK